jgi:hypothetical protein
MKTLVAALAAGLLAISIVAVNMWQQLHDMRTQTTQLRERVTQLQAAQLAAAMAPSAPAAVAAPAAAGITGAPPQAQAAAPAPAADRDKSAGNALLEGISQMLATPEGREMMLGQARMLMPQMYPGLGKALALTPAEEERFFDMLARQQTDSSGDTLGALGGGTPDRATREEMQRKAMERQQANQAEVAAMLGGKVAQWQEYQATLPVRRQVGQLQSSLGTGKALSEAQSGSLIAAINAEQTRIAQDRRNEPRPAAGAPQNFAEAQLQRVTETNRRLLSAATPHLNAEQLASYKRMLDQEESLTRRMVQRQGGQ